MVHSKCGANAGKSLKTKGETRTPPPLKTAKCRLYGKVYFSEHLMRHESEMRKAMTTRKIRDGNPYAENPAKWFEKREVTSVLPRRESLLYKLTTPIRLLVVCVVIWMIAISAEAGVQDGCFFTLRMLGDVSANGKADITELGNGMTVGDPSGWKTATKGTPATPLAQQEPISFQTAKIHLPYWTQSAVTNGYTTLYFPQTVLTVDGGYSNAEQAVTFSYTPSASVLRSGRFRFRWDGYVFDVNDPTSIIFSDGWTWNSADSGSRGYAFYVAKDSSKNDRLFIWVGGKNSYVSGFVPTPGTWYEVVFAFRDNGENGNPDTMDVTVRGENLLKKATIGPMSHTLKFSDTAKIILASQNESATAWKWNGTGNALKVFRGAIAQLDLFDGSLSETEMTALSAGFDGTAWSLGSRNGSSYEFGGDPVAEYDPLTMPWTNMRGELTAANPSVTIKTKIADTDGGLSKFLTVNLLPDGVGGTCPLSVTVNGTPVALAGNRFAGAVDVAAGTPFTFFIPGKLWRGDAEGTATVKLQRAGTVSGTLGIDSLVLSGSWQLGVADGNCAEFMREQYAPEVFYVGDPDTSNHLRRATYPIGSTVSPNSNLVLRCWLPEDVARRCRMRFSMRVSNTGIDNSFTTFALGVGEREVIRKQIKKGDYVETEIMPGVFSGGFNDIKILNLAAEPARWMQYDFFRLTCEPLFGLIMTVR